MSKPPSKPDVERSLERFLARLKNDTADAPALNELSPDTEIENDPDSDLADLPMARQLALLHQRLTQCQALAAGDIVEWKPGLKNRRLPRQGQCAVVIEVLAAPVFDTSDNALSTGSPVFREPHDVKLGVLHDTQLLEYHFDSRRFRRVDAGIKH